MNKILSLEELAANLGETESTDLEPTDFELIDGYIEHFGGTRAQAVERLRRFDFAAFPAGES